MRPLNQYIHETYVIPISPILTGADLSDRLLSHKRWRGNDLKAGGRAGANTDIDPYSSMSDARHALLRHDSFPFLCLCPLTLRKCFQLFKVQLLEARVENTDDKNNNNNNKNNKNAVPFKTPLMMSFNLKRFPVGGVRHTYTRLRTCWRTNSTGGAAGLWSGPAPA